MLTADLSADHLAVLSTYGAGNCPQRKDLLNAFKEASDRGLVIVNVTQCQRGMVEGNLCEIALR